MDSWQTSLRDLLTVVFKRPWSMALIVFLTLFGVLFWLLFIRSETYESYAKVLVKIGNEQTMTNNVARTTPVTITGDRTQDVNSEVDILTSNDLYEAVIDDLKLDQPLPPPPVPQKLLPRIRYEVKQVVRWFSELKDAIMIKAGLKEQLTPREKALSAMRQAVMVQAERNSGIIIVRLGVEIREYGAPILNRLLELYQTFRLKQFRKANMPDFFQARAKEAGGQLKSAEEALRKFEAENNISALEKQEEVLLEQIAREQESRHQAEIELRDVSAKVSRAEAELKAKDPDFARIGSFPPNTFPEVLMQRLGDLQAERERLRMTELESSPRIRTNRDQFRVALGMVLAHLQSVKADRQATFDQRARMVSEMERQVQSLQDKAGQLQSLKRNVKILEEAYVNSARSANDAITSSIMDREKIDSIAIVQHATVPTEASGMSKTRLIGLAALLSLLLAIAYAGIAEFLDHRVLTASDIESRVKASVWEIVPEVERRGLPFQKTTTEPPPDSFRKAAWTVSKAAARGGTALLFSGSNRGAGTTTAILAIAEHLSERYRLRTLVIEADPAQASILDRLNLSTAQTLNRCAPSTPALSCVQKSASGVSYLPLEPGSPLPPARIGEVLAELRTAFDVVLIDGPVITDPDLLALSGSADGVVLIIEAGAIRYEELERLQRDWAAEEVRIAGVVLNRQKRFIPRWIYRSVVEAQ